MTSDQSFKCMGDRIRAAGDGAVPLLVRLHLKAAVHACMALEALRQDEDEGGPDPEAAVERLERLVRLLVLGEE